MSAVFWFFSSSASIYYQTGRFYGKIARNESLLIQNRPLAGQRTAGDKEVWHLIDVTFTSENYVRESIKRKTKQYESLTQLLNGKNIKFKLHVIPLQGCASYLGWFGEIELTNSILRHFRNAAGFREHTCISSTAYTAVAYFSVAAELLQKQLSVWVQIAWIFELKFLMVLTVFFKIELHNIKTATKCQ